MRRRYEGVTKIICPTRWILKGTFSGIFFCFCLRLTTWSVSHEVGLHSQRFADLCFKGDTSNQSSSRGGLILHHPHTSTGFHTSRLGNVPRGDMLCFFPGMLGMKAQSVPNPTRGLMYNTPPPHRTPYRWRSRGQVNISRCFLGPAFKFVVLIWGILCQQ